jgi:hypothetical protein
VPVLAAGVAQPLLGTDQRSAAASASSSGTCWSNVSLPMFGHYFSVGHWKKLIVTPTKPKHRKKIFCFSTRNPFWLHD